MSVDTLLDDRAAEYRAVLSDAAQRFAATTTAEHGPKLYDHVEYLELYASFSQGWGSTCGGFPGIGGQIMTASQTWVVIGLGAPRFLIYFGARLAHATDDGEWVADCIKRHRFPPSHMPRIKPGDPVPVRAYPDNQPPPPGGADRGGGA